MTVANLFARIGLKADTGKVEEFSKSIKNVAKDLKAAALGAVAFTTAVVASMKGAMDTAKTYRDFQNESGASTDELQRWQAVAAGANVSTDALSEAVKNLASNREKIKLGQGNMSGFAFLGINPMDDPFQILQQLREKTAGLPQAMKRNLLEQMGVSSQFLQILNLTDAEFNKMRNDAFIIPPSAFEAMNQTQGSLNTLGRMIQWFQALLAEKLAPTITKFVKDIIHWVEVNKNGLIDGIVKGTQFLLKFLGAIVNVTTWISTTVEKTIGWKNTIYALIGVWLLFNRAMLASPITWIIGGILLLIAVMDDLHAALHIGGDNRKSFFGGVFEKFPGLKKMFQDTFGFLSDMAKAIGALFSGNSRAFDEAIKKWGTWAAIVKDIAASFKLIGDILGTIFDQKLSTVEKFGKMNDQGGTFLRSIGLGWLADMLGQTGHSQKDIHDLSEARNALKSLQEHPMSDKELNDLKAKYGTPDQGVMQYVINNNISGVSDPRAAAALATDGTKRALGSTSARNIQAQRAGAN